MPAPPQIVPITVRRSDDRYHTRLDWLDSRHSFSFGPHYDPGNVGHGLLIVSNDDVVGPGRGFGSHSHRDMEIVTWVLDGELEHRDSEGNHGVLYPGLAQRMSAGTGITHSETNHSDAEPVRFVQMWVIPAATGLPPEYEQRDMNDALAAGDLVVAASGRDRPGALRLRQPAAEMSVARMSAGGSVEIAAAPLVHVYVARGEVSLGAAGPDGSARLAAGDAIGTVDAGPITMTAREPSEIIVWEFTEEIVR